MKQSRYVRLSLLWTYLLTYAYAIFVWVLFWSTTEGWSGLIYMIGAPYLLAFFTSMFVVILVRQKMQTLIVLIPVYLFYLLPILQSILVILNPGDCGDSRGQSIWLQRQYYGDALECLPRTGYLYATMPLQLLFMISLSLLLVFAVIAAKPKKEVYS